MLLKIGIILWLSMLAEMALAQAKEPREATRKVAVLLAYDGRPRNALFDFYRATFQAVDTSGTWTATPVTDLRAVLTARRVDQRQIMLPTIDAKRFRQSLTARKPDPKITRPDHKPGRLDEIQGLLDTLGLSIAVIVDCRSDKAELLRSCGLYYYDRSEARVRASSIKTFEAGVSDAGIWAQPMLKNLMEGIQAAQKSRDQEMIQALMGRDDEDEDDMHALLGVAIRGENLQVDQKGQTIAELALQLGFLQDHKGAFLEFMQGERSSQGELRSIKRQSLGLQGLWQARALDSLLWRLELGGGQERTLVEMRDNAGQLKVQGFYLALRVGVGLILRDAFTLDLGPQGRYFMEQKSEGEGLLKDASLSADFFDGFYLRLGFSW